MYNIVRKYFKHLFAVIRDVKLLNECVLFAWFVIGWFVIERGHLKIPRFFRNIIRSSLRVSKIVGIRFLI